MAGETTRRGYGTAHQRIRAYWAPIVAAGRANCWRCGLPIPPATEWTVPSGRVWHVGHDGGRRTRGPEHAKCNLEAAAAKTNGTPAGRPLTSEDW